MKNFVEVLDLVHCKIDVMRDGEKIEVGTGDESQFQQVIVEEAAPRFPIESILTIHQNDRHQGGFPRLKKCEDFKPFIHCSKSSGKENEGRCFLHKAKFSGKKVIEIDQLGIAFNCRIRSLLKRQPDIESETFLRAGPLLGSTHDPITSTGDDHKILSCDPSREFPGKFEIRIVSQCSGRAKDSDFADAGVFLKD